MFKIAGSIIIITMFMFAGIFKSYKLNKRLKYLMEFRNMFEDLKFEINLKTTELPHAVEQIGSLYNNSCFIKWFALMKSLGAEASFCQSLEENAEIYCFNKKDIGILKCLVASLGRLDLDSQIDRLNGGILAIDKHLTEAKCEQNDKIKLYVGGSVLLGVFIVILLI